MKLIESLEIKYSNEIIKTPLTPSPKTIGKKEWFKEEFLDYAIEQLKSPTTRPKSDPKMLILIPKSKKASPRISQRLQEMPKQR